ncbi:unnamed protein product [Mycena citricolor]|uniref:non-specific serine/threonine protein kinase n=1 Tax=Mycena citricolor TaxID=2018698 RepID=A0AAD2HZ43_9AGAR|nr:unnamed protein product [Mycena citricolor]
MPSSSSRSSVTASSTLPDLTGETVENGRLLLLSLLGSGAYGKVYKALDTSSPTNAPAYYAVKCMPQYEPDSRGQKMVANELHLHRIGAMHPRIIAFHRVFTMVEPAPLVFVVLDFCDGGDFFTAMVDRGLYSGKPHIIKVVFGQILDGVEFLHRMGIYHRDLKPENILCGDSETGLDIRLADFGLSTQKSVSFQFGCGSRFYMSPESINGSRNLGYSPRDSDMWALSVVFTNLITGRHPWFSAEDTDAGYTAYRLDNTYLLRALKISHSAFDLLRSCFHEDPRQRPDIPALRKAVVEMDYFTMEDECSGRTSKIPVLGHTMVDANPLGSAGLESACDETTPRQADASRLHAPSELSPVLSSRCESMINGLSSMILSSTTSHSSLRSSENAASDSSLPTTPTSSVESSSSSDVLAQRPSLKLDIHAPLALPPRAVLKGVPSRPLPAPPFGEVQRLLMRPRPLPLPPFSATNGLTRSVLCSFAVIRPGEKRSKR